MIFHELARQMAKDGAKNQDEGLDKMLSGDILEGASQYGKGCSEGLVSSVASPLGACKGLLEHRQETRKHSNGG